MNKVHARALTALVGILAIVLVLAGPALSQRPAPGAKGGTLTSRLAASAKITDEQAQTVLKELPNIIRERLAAGEVVEVPGLGVFKVVQIPEHKDLVQGRVATIAAQNYVSFSPTGSLASAANSPSARPAAEVPNFLFTPLPDQVQSQKTPYIRQPNTRIR